MNKLIIKKKKQKKTSSKMHPFPFELKGPQVGSFPVTTRTNHNIFYLLEVKIRLAHSHD